MERQLQLNFQEEHKQVIKRQRRACTTKKNVAKQNSEESTFAFGAAMLIVIGLLFLA